MEVTPSNYESYWNIAPKAAAGRAGQPAAPAAGYAAGLRRDDPFVVGLMRIPSLIKTIGAYAATDNMTRAKEAYDQLNGFYSDHADKMADAVDVDPKGDPLLDAVQRGALAGYDRAFDRVIVNTRLGQMPIGDLFGPGGRYASYKEDELRSQLFTQRTIDAMNGDDADLKSTLETLTAPLLGQLRPGEVQAPRSQYVDLAHEVASFWADDVKDVGVEAVRAAVSHVKDFCMGDGTAVAVYRDVLDNAKARIESGAETDGAQAVRSVFSAYKSLLDSSAGGSKGQPAPASARRMMATLLTDAVSANPDLDLDDAYTRKGMYDIMGLFAAAERAGASLLPVMQESGAEFRKAVSGYIASAGQGLPVPQDNLFVQVGNASRRLSGLLTEGWYPASTTARANPAEAVGDAAGVFGARSGSGGLDYATVSVYGSLMKDLTRRISRGEREPDAFVGMLADGSSVDAVAGELEDAMLVPRSVADGVARTLFANMAAGGAVRPTGVEQAVATFAFGGSAADSVDVQVARETAAKWYAANLGPNSRGYDELLRGWDSILNDDLVGFGMTREGKARSEAMKQQVRQEMAELSARGLPAEALAREYYNKGKFYYISGFQNNDTGEVLDKLPEGVAKAMQAGDQRQVAKLLSSYSPVVDVGFGDLNRVKQPIAGWTPLGLGALTAFGENTWTDNQRLFRTAMEQLKSIYDARMQKMSKEIAKHAAETASEP